LGTVTDTPQSTDLTPDFLRFCADDEMQAKREAIQWMQEYYDSTTCDQYAHKWHRGCAEHGIFTEKKLYGVDWFDQKIQEFQDAFYFTEIQRYKLYREGNLLPGDPYPPTR